MALEFDQGLVPGLPKETLGEVFFVKTKRVRMDYDGNESTGEIKERPVECSSAAQETIFIVNFPPEVRIEDLKNGDIIELEGVEFRFWSSIDRQATSAYVNSDIKVTATGYKKTGKNVFQSMPGTPPVQDKGNGSFGKEGPKKE
ncbi:MULTISPECIES: DUF961 family protein [Enterococcus]|uniref:DUF961 domain-containing protein n=1 Tax=Enterococcus gallinarum TaxID=1353 RepID=A0A376H2K8_ENTGA|nr:DUF961 family protein [Enterococcus gallinarum]EGO8423956.1 DUF961 domain-containing protein [Enterococcus faecalis]OJG48037.1 hypothetical protein RV03_GL001484 [Enterococcus gallinarum]STD72732.1 Uncharacterised protein [Enterococcus gallinarum]STD82638.1 Uncharacterised protein [Enterococcus gallinarum]